MKTEKSNPIRQYIELTGLTLREVAQKTGMSHQSVWLHATGQRQPGPKALRMYHKTLGISLEKLIE